VEFKSVCVVSNAGLFVGHHLLVRDFGPYVIMFTNAFVVVTITVVWLSFAIKGFWTLWDNIITVATVMLLKKAIKFLSRCFVETVHRNKDCSLIHVFLHSAAKQAFTC
jgi:hypothetical protein